jgi:hypothetical protein
MAATLDSEYVIPLGQMIEQHSSYSSLTSDASETLTIRTALGAPNKTPVLDVAFEQTAAATSGDMVSFEHIVASDSTSGNTVAWKARVAPGADIAGAKVKVKVRWHASARQDGQTISSDNNT